METAEAGDTSNLVRILKTERQRRRMISIILKIKQLLFLVPYLLYLIIQVLKIKRYNLKQPRVSLETQKRDI